MKTRKLSRSLLAAVLAMVMLCGLCASAYATSAPAADPHNTLATDNQGNTSLRDNAPPPTEPSDAPDTDEPTLGEPPVADVPLELPVTAGISYHAPNQLDMVPADVLFDTDLNRTIITFKLSDAGLLSALIGYCEPDYLLAEEVARWKALNDDPQSFLHELVIPRQEKPLWEMLSRTAQRKITDEMKVWEIIDLLKNRPEGQYPSQVWDFLSDYELYTLKVNDFRQMVTDLTVNGGGGPDYHYYTVGQLLKAAEEVVATEEFQKFAEAAAPLKSCEKTTAKALRLQFTEEELAEICKNLRATAYGDWSIMLRWLDEMTFSMVLPADDGETSFGFDFGRIPACSDNSAVTAGDTTTTTTTNTSNGATDDAPTSSTATSDASARDTAK